MRDCYSRYRVETKLQERDHHASIAWLVRAAFLFAVVPFTLIVILPTNKELESETLDVSSARAEQLLRRWNALHAVRSGLSLVAFPVFLYALHRKS
jgi:hypothetical protein